MGNDPRNKESHTPCLIKRFAVDKLFGTNSYDFMVPMTTDSESGKLLLLYGDNGSGKTTILNLIYNLLSPEPYEGHRSYVGRTPFSFIEIEMNNGTTIRAKRTSGWEPGSYTITVVDGQRIQLTEWTWNSDNQSRVRSEDEEYENFCSVLKNLPISFYYLRDSRRVAGAESSDKAYHEAKLRQRYQMRLGHSIDLEDEGITDAADILLHQSVERAIQWFRQQALAGTNLGSSSVNSIYKDIIARLVTYGGSESTTTSALDSVDSLKAELQSLHERNEGYAKFGLTPNLEIDELLGYLGSANSQNVPLLQTVLGPYLESHKARLDALQDVQRVMEDFVSLLCSFYSRKSVSVHLREGLTILAAGTQQGINLSTLSSGEKQLLLLLCHAVSVRETGTVFIIDEPEISLNVKWQRKLVQALLTCLAGTDSQIVLATHSIELLAQYKNYVISLDSTFSGEM